MINSVCILGGGTSGLIAALVLKTWYPKMDVDIIESSNIGIIGVGEGSTEHWANFIQAVNISVQELLLETGATFKSGIRFNNWNGDNKFYMHSLHAEYTQSLPNALPGIMVQLITDNAEHLCPDNIINSEHLFPIVSSVNQYHFDTVKLNAFLHKKCKERGVSIKEDDIKDVLLTHDGHVKSLLGSKNDLYSADFFIDSSGFNRVISSKLGAKWISCKDNLPMDSAFAFPTAHDGKNYPSYTTSTAMSSGWSWKIPTQERYGNGYVYSSDFLTHDEAVAEIQALYDEPVEVRKSFKFTAGYVDKFWIKNCVSIGLAGSFVEPLEASSIGTSIQQSLALGAALISWEPNEELTAKTYNKQFELVAKNIIDFVQLHYITQRNDSPFWQHCKNIKLTDFNQETLEHFKNTIPTRAYYSSTQWLMFSENNWLQVLYGLNLFNTDRIAKMWNQQDPSLLIEAKNIVTALELHQQHSPKLSHYEALEYLKKGK